MIECLTVQIKLNRMSDRSNQNRKIPLLVGITLCKYRELSRREYLMSQLCSIRHGIPVTQHTPYGQWSAFDYNADKQVGCPRDNIWDLVALVWPSRVITTSWALVKCWNFFRWPQCWFHEIEIFAMYRYIPVGLNHLLNVGVDQWLQICRADTCQWVYVMVNGLFC